MIYHLMGFPILEGNSIRTLVNGDQIFPAMLEAVRSAQKTITLETYIYWSGEIGREFADALSQRAKAGVPVYVIIDSYGGIKLDKDVIERMREAGVHVRMYHPFKWFQILNFQRMNRRSHRKLLIVDGRIAFTGGVGIADNWLGNADSAEHWRDNHYRLEGPIVGSLQAVFMDHWLEENGEVFLAEEFFPEIKTHGTLPAQCVKSNADTDTSNAHALALYALASARNEVTLATAYFVPDSVTRQALIEPRQRGVRVQIIVPGPITDYHVVRWASRSLWGELLQAGIEICEYMPTLYHCKMMIVDDEFVSIGSVNIDNRSFRLNDECNVNVFDREFAHEQMQLIRDDLTKCQQVTYEKWRNRPLKQKVRERLSSLLRGML